MVCIWLCQTYQAVSINLGELQEERKYQADAKKPGRAKSERDFVHA
jgi:hypothetical protein